MTVWTQAFATPAVLAAASLVAMPATAAELPTASHVSVAPLARQASVGIGWGSGWGWGGRHHRRHRGTSAGDVLTGILILGTIAAVANASTRRSERREYPVRYPYPERRGDYRAEGPQGLDGAADMCLREVERNARAREVTRVERSASGWLVTGAMADGRAFTCSIGADGRIGSVDVGGRPQAHGDEAATAGTEPYRSARAGTDGAAKPAYPGGPLPGEDPEALPEAPSSDN